MEKSRYAMAKFGLEAKEAMPKRDCGFYVKYIFLFTSLIQFLIILGLVLFMVYGNAQAGTDTHLRLLEEQLQDRYNKIITLSGRNMNLTRTLNATLKEKQGLQVLAQKVQRDLDKCNSTQGSNPIPKVSPPPSPGKEGKAPWVLGAATHPWVLGGAGTLLQPHKLQQGWMGRGWAEPAGHADMPPPSPGGGSQPWHSRGSHWLRGFHSHSPPPHPPQPSALASPQRSHHRLGGVRRCQLCVGGVLAGCSDPPPSSSSPYLSCRR